MPDGRDGVKPVPFSRLSCVALCRVGVAVHCRGRGPSSLGEYLPALPQQLGASRLQSVPGNNFAPELGAPSW